MNAILKKTNEFGLKYLGNKYAISFFFSFSFVQGMHALYNGNYGTAIFSVLVCALWATIKETE